MSQHSSPECDRALMRRRNEFNILGQVSQSLPSSRLGRLKSRIILKIRIRRSELSAGRLGTIIDSTEITTTTKSARPKSHHADDTAIFPRS
eukprot:764549-Hanusia_phi.AAC.2